MMHKLLNLENFSVYWDVDTEMFGELSQSDLAVCLAPPILSLKLTLKQYLTFFVVIIFDKNKNNF